MNSEVMVMKKKHMMVHATFCMMLLFVFHITYGKADMVSQINQQETEYVVRFQSEKALISRDGSEAVPIANGTKLTKPGTYFLTLLDSKQGVKINTFQIPSKKGISFWAITRESELEEIFKYTLENFETDITIKFNFGVYDINALNRLFEKNVNKVLEKYPKLTYEGYTIRVAGEKNPIIDLKFVYPLKVTNTLKNYDTRTDQLLIQIINETITADMPDYKREVALFKYIIERITYSATNNQGVSYVNPTPMSHTMYGGLIERVAVCDGYAKSLMYLLNAVGVPAQLVVGNTYDGVLHAWNLVKIQGSYYHVDSTWGDADEDQVGAFYEYLNEKDTYMQKTHRWDTTKYPAAIQLAYNILYMPIQVPDTYRIKNKRELDNALSNIGKKIPVQATMVFYEDAANKWQEEELVNKIVGSARKPIIYRAERKYNCLVLSFKID